MAVAVCVTFGLGFLPTLLPEARSIDDYLWSRTLAGFIDWLQLPAAWLLTTLFQLEKDGKWVDFVSMLLASLWWGVIAGLVAYTIMATWPKARVAK